MTHGTDNTVRPGYEPKRDPKFPHAPIDWSPEDAEKLARTESLTLTEDHWEVVRGLQELFARSEEPVLRARDLHDALDEHFHYKGGIKYLYELFPKGPVAQGCRLAGLQAPTGAQDQGFGSAV
jgi:tRNA 2-thiouridine synthesizing protein E